MKKDFIGGKQITRKQALKKLWPVWGLQKDNFISWGGAPMRRWRVVSNGTFVWGPWEFSRRAAIWSWVKSQLKHYYE